MFSDETEERRGGFAVQRQKSDLKEKVSKIRRKQERNKGTTKTISRCPLGSNGSSREA